MKGLQARFAIRVLLLAAFAALAGGCEDWPKDPEKTLERVRGGTLRAGVLHSPPWIEFSGNEPAGIEAEVVRHVADRLGANVRWVRGAPDQLLALLEERELHILVGGFENRSPVLRKVSATRPYATFNWWLLAREPVSPETLKQKEVLVEHGRAAVLVRKAEGIPVLANGAAEESVMRRVLPLLDGRIQPGWHRVAALGATSHVLATPPGESAWLVAVDRLLHELGNELSGPLACKDECGP